MPENAATLLFLKQNETTTKLCFAPQFNIAWPNLLLTSIKTPFAHGQNHFRPWAKHQYTLM